MRAISRRTTRARRVFILAAGRLKAQVELLLLQVNKLVIQLVGGLGAKVFGLNGSHQPLP